MSPGHTALHKQHFLLTTLQTEYIIRVCVKQKVCLISPHKVVLHPNIAHTYRSDNTSTGHTSSTEMSSYFKESLSSTSCFCQPLVAPHTRLSGRALSVLLVLKKQTLHSVVLYLCSQKKSSIVLFDYFTVWGQNRSTFNKRPRL